MQRLNRLFLNSLSLFVLVLLFGFDASQAQVLPVFRIGVLDTLDGELTHGAQLAVQEINDAGGVLGADGTSFQLQLVIQPPDDLSFALSNLNQASVIAVIGPADSQTVLGNRQALTALGVPILTTATDDTIIPNDTTDLIMRLRAPASVQGRALADYLVNALNAATIATVQLDVESTVEALGFQRALSQLGVTPIAEYIASQQTNIQQITLDLVAAQPQFIVAYGEPETVGAMYTTLRENDWPGRFVYGRSDRPEFRQTVQEGLLEGVLGVNTWSYTLADEPSQSFIFSYIRAFGEIPTSFTAAGYDSVYMLREAIGRTGTLQGNLLSINSFGAVQGTLTPAVLTRGEFSENVVITRLGEFGAPIVAARYLGVVRIPLEEPDFVPATPTPQATATPDGVFLTISRAVQNVRTGPGLNYDIIGQLQEGDTARVIGATIDFSWVAIEFRGTIGWLSRAILDLQGDTNTIPVLTPPPSPTPPPATPTPTPQPIADIIVTSGFPNRLTIGVPFSVTANIRNQGGANASTFAVAATYEPGEVFTSQTLQGLGAGSEVSISLSGTLSGATGLYNVAIVADLNNQVNEGAVGESNNIFVHSYIADAPQLVSATVSVGNLGTISFDGAGNDIQWGGGGIVPLGTTELVVLDGFASFDAVHRDAIAAAPLVNVPITPATAGLIIGFRTDTGNRLGALQIVSATPGGDLTINYRAYE